MRYLQRRDNVIDAFRGIGILLVVLGHIIGDTQVPLNKLILSFHMPLFFFCSGMLANVNGGGTGVIAKEKLRKR